MPDKKLTQSQIADFQRQIDRIKSSPFSVQKNLKDAIELGNKLAAVKLNSRFFSQFKTTTANWMKMCKKLKSTDFTLPLEELGNLKTILEQIKSGAQDYTKNKKAIAKDIEDKEVAIEARYKEEFPSYVTDHKQMEKILDVMRPFRKNKNLMHYLDTVKIPNTPEKLELAIQGFPEDSKFKKHHTTLSALIKPTPVPNLKEFYIALQQLNAKELEIVAWECYHATSQVYETTDMGDMGTVTTYCKDPVMWLEKLGGRSRSLYRFPQLSKRKREFNILKVKYMEEMHTAAQNSLKAT